MTSTQSNLPYPYWWNGTACDTTKVKTSTPLAYYRGMPACGPTGLPAKRSDEVRFTNQNKQPVGVAQYEWQCVELVMRYLYLAYQVVPYPAPGGKDVVKDFPLAKYPGLMQQVNNDGKSQTAPQIGDVLSYSDNDPNNTAGHTSIVTGNSVNSSGNGTISVIQQNSSKATANLAVTKWVIQPFTYNGKYKMQVTGWLHVLASSPVHGYLNGVATISANDVWAVGFNSTNSSTQTLIEQWNGSNWVVISSPNAGSNNSELYAVTALSASDIWSVGDYYDSQGNSYTLIEQWNGTSWNIVQSPTPSGSLIQLDGVAAVSTNDVWAIGNYETSNNTYQSFTEQWNGTSWSIISTLNIGMSNQLNGIVAVSNSDIWAVGYYEDYSYNWYTLTEQWNGTSWNYVASPNPSSHSYLNLFGVTAASANNISAVGYYEDSNSQTYTLIEQWNGTSWSITPSPNAGVLNQFNGIAAVSGGDTWAVGYYEDSNLNNYTLIEQWNGTRWNVVSSPNVNGYNNQLNTIAAISTSDVWAVGAYSPSNSNNTLIEQWNGTSWSIVPSP